MVALLAAGAVGAGALTGRAGSASASVAAADPTPTPSPTPTEAPPRPSPAVQAAARDLRMCSIASLAQDPRLATFEGQVRDAATGRVLFDRNGSTPERTASVMKVITSAAALAALGPDRRIATTVVRGSEPGTVVLVGGGDPTLTRLTSGSSVYPGAPRLSDLAQQVRTAWAADPATAGTPITRIVLDTSLFSGDTWIPSWAPTERKAGYSSFMTPLQLDADRADPAAVVSARSEDPLARVGSTFRSMLGGSADVTQGTAPAGAAVLGKVESQPVSSLIQTALINSDNVLAESLARLVSIQVGAGNTQQSLATGIPKALQAYGLDTSTLTIVDGQGLSPDDRVPPSFLAQLMIQVDQRQQALGYLHDGLPVAGRTGTLSSRFTGDSAVARGHVVAKTGWIDTGYTLAGIVDAADGTKLTFAFYAIGNVTGDAKIALDALAAGTYRCGADLGDE
ncbi:D-alanyl-D-alanine carboxypeptidase/D-alanyl-D-alanine-endopeptidase [Clavibacter michiganensis subsp. insidiosus]|uniref:D-alanyl-D-alanine carboxypeptidase n=1 Tax=Clavibacter michiganensis subsp. insidiosus TaxID=33014 RepID=A0A0D5CML7_9MICO|nr:D-alanyl-D-alanine carboxypeptidase [Clavibacter michiganensis subsp. insidiosus]AWF99063.1 D-alanyl-D-alanine carboxypeptidase [Clavibacter michiganensis subsp. insidiosus]OQJ61354.1 D-alanyl-D-alanine carboxypeptidase/D-alanyl-D-alanine-endopeptidase [Clavibacter michiganensis subsp. insidiosus]RMC84832.1 D-alanyl-D-alanine carboxypeptidase/D-alanyl-D-alanine-endopeptidase [Clavibacter michiganensis subsp. insidiosus]